MSADIIEFIGPSSALSFRARLLGDKNLHVVNNLLAMLPLSSFLLHVVVAGETIYTPVPSMSLSSKNMVERRPGTIYYNTTSQSICFCYGAVTESTRVNQFAQVLDEDLEKLRELGKVVYEQTVQNRVKKIVKISARKFDHENSAAAQGNGLTPITAKDFDGSWISAKKIIDQEAARLRLPEEPDDIKAIRLGAIKSRAGSEGSPFQTFVFLQGFLSTLGPHVFSRLITVSAYEEMTLPLMVRQTREFLIETFNHFDFLGDLGLTNMGNIGKLYNAALDSLTSLDEYRQLTDSVRSLVQLWYRWLHLIFPWYLKEHFQCKTAEEVASLPKLEVYSEKSESG